MLKRSLLSLAMLLGTGALMAQDNAYSKSNPPKLSSKYSHYVGVQVNPLFKQILSFGNTQEVDNPFLLKYSIRENSSQREITAGVGFTLDNSIDQDGFEATTSDLSLRGGVAKRYNLGNRFEVGIGADLIFNYQRIGTFNIQAFNFGGGSIDSTITQTTSKVFGYGIGPQINLSYNLTDNIMIGTEMTYYYMYTFDYLNVETERHTGNGTGGLQVTTDSVNTEEKSSVLNLNIPVALFLIVRF